MKYISIDIGTTNTRVRLIDNDNIIRAYKEQVGVRDTTLTGSKKKIKAVVKKGIEECLINVDRINEIKIIASGMCTSNLGLLEIPHLNTPVSVEDLANHMIKETFVDIIDGPIYFVPGVKNNTDDVERIDMMRGEEVEAFGALHLLEIEDNVLFVSPGSHTKFVFINNREIEKCSTTLTGEILWALANHTILSNSISSEMISSIDEEFILKGINSAKDYGFSKCCFMIRIMDTYANTTSNQRANFLAGAICYYDILSVSDDLKDNELDIIISGPEMLRQLYFCTFKLLGYDDKKIKLMSSEMVDKASSVGGIKILNAYLQNKG